MRLGIFGGSFDPVHNGHLAVARACQAEASLDEVWFTPAAIQPLKRRGPHATDAQRVEMLRLAIEGLSSSEPGRARPWPTWRVCTLEIERGGFSYTIDTMRQLYEELPEAELFFLMGADTVADVAQWKEPRELFWLATPILVARSGEAPSDDAMRNLVSLLRDRPIIVNLPPVDVSSSAIRRRIAAEEPIENLVPPAVAEYIRKHALYR